MLTWGEFAAERPGPGRDGPGAALPGGARTRAISPRSGPTAGRGSIPSVPILTDDGLYLVRRVVAEAGRPASRPALRVARVPDRRQRGRASTSTGTAAPPTGPGAARAMAEQYLVERAQASRNRARGSRTSSCSSCSSTRASRRRPPATATGTRSTRSGRPAAERDVTGAGMSRVTGRRSTVPVIVGAGERASSRSSSS